MTKVGAIIAREMEESEARGEVRGKVLSLLTVLSSKGEVPEKLEQKIQEQTKGELLDQWLKIAAVAPDVATFEEKIMH